MIYIQEYNTTDFIGHSKQMKEKFNLLDVQLANLYWNRKPNI